MTNRKHSEALRHAIFCLAGVLLALAGSDSRAQGAGEIVEKARAQQREALGEAEPGGGIQLPAPPEVREADDTPLELTIEVIRLIAHQDRTDKEAVFEIEAPVMIDEDLMTPEGLKEKLESEYIGKAPSMASLEQVTKDIITSYRESDYPLVDVFLPEQNITTGKLQIVVREAVLGKLKVEGAKHSSPDYLMKQIRVAAGERINTRLLEGDIDWMNSNPSRRVDLIYERGELDGSSDIILKTEDSSPLGSYLSFGNTGLEATGIYEWAAGFSLSNLAGTEHGIAYNFSGDADLGNLNSHVAVYELPLPWRNRLQFLGAYVTSKSGSELGLDDLDVNGESIQGTVNYKIPLPKINGKYRQNVTLSADYKSTNTDILFGGDDFSDSNAIVFQYRLGYDLTVPDKLGYTLLDLGGVYSPGDVLNGNCDENFDELRADSPANYSYFTGEIERVFKLPGEWSLKISALGQATDARLIPTEQLLAGGYRTVRGVDEYKARGDRGFIGNVELIAPPVSLWKRQAPASSPSNGGKEQVAAETEAVDGLTVFGFYDTAYLFSVGAFASEPDQNLHTTGLGLNYRLGDHYGLRASYGWVLEESGFEFIGSGRFHFGLNLSF